MGKHIAAHYDKAMQYEGKAEQQWTAIAQYLAKARAACNTGGFRAFRERFCPHIGKTRAYELVRIGSGEKTVADTRAETAERTRKSRAAKKAAAKAGEVSATVADGKPVAERRKAEYADGDQAIEDHGAQAQAEYAEPPVTGNTAADAPAPQSDDEEERQVAAGSDKRQHQGPYIGFRYAFGSSIGWWHGDIFSMPAKMFCGVVSSSHLRKVADFLMKVADEEAKEEADNNNPATHDEARRVADAAAIAAEDAADQTAKEEGSNPVACDEFEVKDLAERPLEGLGRRLHNLQARTKDTERIDWETSHPEEAKAKARKQAQDKAIKGMSEQDLKWLKDEAKEDGVPWKEIKDEKFAEWLADNWEGSLAEERFERDFNVGWAWEHGTAHPEDAEGNLFNSIKNADGLYEIPDEAHDAARRLQQDNRIQLEYSGLKLFASVPKPVYIPTELRVVPTTAAVTAAARHCDPTTHRRRSISSSAVL